MNIVYMTYFLGKEEVVSSSLINSSEIQMVTKVTIFFLCLNT